MSKSYAVFGLGRYGRAVVKELLNNGAEVLAVDQDRRIVDELVGEIPVCKCADITEPGVIEQLGISDIDIVVISMAKNFEGSIMATMLCKENGVKKVLVKCSNESQCKVLKKIGADEVILPETESGIRLAKNLISSGFIDIADISDEISILEIDVKSKWVGKTLQTLELRKKYNINIMAFKKGNDVIFASPDMVLDNSVKMIVMADKKGIAFLKDGIK